MKQQNTDFCNGCCYKRTCDGDLEKCCYLIGNEKCYVMEDD